MFQTKSTTATTTTTKANRSSGCVGLLFVILLLVVGGCGVFLCVVAPPQIPRYEVALLTFRYISIPTSSVHFGAGIRIDNRANFAGADLYSLWVDIYDPATADRLKPIGVLLTDDNHDQPNRRTKHNNANDEEKRRPSRRALIVPPRAVSERGNVSIVLRNLDAKTHWHALQNTFVSMNVLVSGVAHVKFHGLPLSIKFICDNTIHTMSFQTMGRHCLLDAIRPGTPTIQEQARELKERVQKRYREEVVRQHGGSLKTLIDERTRPRPVSRNKESSDHDMESNTHDDEEEHSLEMISAWYDF